MATRRNQSKSTAAEPISQEPLADLKAREFARLSRQTGWRLAWLVASSCEPGSAGRPAKSATGSQLLVEKVSMNQFAKLTGKGRATIQFYYKAWNLAHEDGMVPCTAEDVGPEVEWVDGHMEPPDEFRLDDDDLGRPWEFYFDWAKTGARPNPKRYEDNSDEDENEKPEAKSEEKNGSQLETDDEDESDSIDEDFGLPDAMSEDEVAEADSSIQRESLLDVLETIQALTGKVSNVGEVTGDNDALLGQIASAALDLNSVANAMVAKSEVTT